MVWASLVAIADTHLQLKTPGVGHDVLEDFIYPPPQDSDLARLFAKLDELYGSERKPSRAQLESWIRDPAQPRRAFAQRYLARLELRAGHRERALQLFAVLQNKEKSADLAPAFLEFAELEMEDRRFDDALTILNQARGLHPDAAILERINLLAAQTQYRARRFETATIAFEQVARSPSPFANISMFDAALGWLQLCDHDRFLADFQGFAKAGGEAKSQAYMRFKEGQEQAANGDKRATDSLQNFLHDFPQNERASEAWVALAELAFHASHPRMDEARKDLARAAESKPTAAAEERGGYLASWIEDAAGGDDATEMDMAKRFPKGQATIS